MATLFVATAGGHLAQLAEISERLPSESDDTAVWVTNENTHSRSLLNGKHVVFVPEVRPRDVPEVLRCLPVVHRLHREWKFTRAISTGSGLALGFLPYVAVRGVPTHYIESASRMGSASLTGRILGAMPRIHLYTQYRYNEHGRWHYGGSVFDSFERTPVTESAPVRRAVVVLGTMEARFQFRRLLDALVPLLASGGALEQAQGTPVETLWQTGSTVTDGLAITATPWVPSADLDAAIRRADLVVGHAGAGTALTTLLAGRLPVLAPRDEARGEVNDAHQQQFARELDARGLALCREPERIGLDDLFAAAGCRVARAAPAPFALRGKAAPAPAQA